MLVAVVFVHVFFCSVLLVCFCSACACVCVCVRACLLIINISLLRLLIRRLPQFFVFPSVVVGSFTFCCFFACSCSCCRVCPSFAFASGVFARHHRSRCPRLASEVWRFLLTGHEPKQAWSHGLNSLERDIGSDIYVLSIYATVGPRSIYFRP